jgi:hypothetical protein
MSKCHHKQQEIHSTIISVASHLIPEKILTTITKKNTRQQLYKTESLFIVIIRDIPSYRQLLLRMLAGIDILWAMVQDLA